MAQKEKNESTEEATSALSEVVIIKYLTSENTEFFAGDGYITMKEKGSEGEPLRVFLHRAFPYEEKESFISVLDRDNVEVGMIRDISEFDEETARILRRELERKYFILKIKKVYSVKERYGFSYWETESEEGRLGFTLHDTYRSIIRVDSDRIFLNDVDGNRYEITSLKALDRKSYKKLELYL